MQKIILKIEQENLSYVDESQLECFLLSSSLSEKFVKDFCEKASKADKIVLVEEEQTYLNWKNFGVDGVIVDVSKIEKISLEIKRIREIIGKNTFLGLVSRSRRHEAMIVSEAEPEFVIFKVWNDGLEKMKELIDWYHEFFLIQQAAYIMDDEIDVSQLSSDIIILSEKKYKILVDKN